MHNDIVTLFEKKREELRETQRAFAKRLFPGLKPTSAATFYSQIAARQRRLPKSAFVQAAEILGVPIETLNRKTNLTRIAFVGVASRIELTGEQLRYLADIADAAKKPVRLDLLLGFLVDQKEPPSK